MNFEIYSRPDCYKIGFIWISNFEWTTVESNFVSQFNKKIVFISINLKHSVIDAFFIYLFWYAASLYLSLNQLL